MTLEISKSHVMQAVIEEQTFIEAPHHTGTKYIFPGMRIGVIIPAFNEMENIVQVIKRIPTNISDELYIIVVDDGSADDTSKVVQQTDAILIAHATNQGYGAALRTGIDFCVRHKMDVIVNLDADGQHDPRYLEDIVRPIIEKRADFTLGNRHKEQYVAGNPYKRVFSQLMSLVYSVLFGKRISDPTNGFRAFSYRLVANQEFESSYTITQEILFKIIPKYQFEQVPMKVHGRLQGNSFIRFHKYLRNTGIAFFKFFLKH